MEEAFASDGLSPEDLAVYETELAEEIAAAEEGTADVPGVLAATFGAPYDLGAPLVLGLRNEGGNERLDQAFADPPTTEEHLFHPLTYLDREWDQGDAPEDVDLEVDDALDQDVFGSIGWYLMLVERIDPELALQATDGWDGGSYALFETGGRVCVRAAFSGDTSRDEDEMADAIMDWAEAIPTEEPTTFRTNGKPGFTACDPGAQADLELTGRSERAMAVPGLRSYLIADALTTLDPEGAACFADEAMSTLTFTEITDPDGSAFDDASFDDAIEAAMETCQDS